MKLNKTQRSLMIISEIHPQFLGSMSELKRMILQSKIGGADYVKVQLYSSKKLFNNSEREYLEISKKELKEIKNFSDTHGIGLTASIFDEERLDWCEELDFDFYKIASRTLIDDFNLCEKIVSTKKMTIASLGMYDYSKGKPFSNSNVKYLYCVSKYPTQLYELNMPNFKDSFFDGFSDHTVGIAACLHAVSKGAEIVEKHFSNSKNLNVETQQAHTCSMDVQDLNLLRHLSDSINLISKKDK
jgi:sialic acid synthase SpsE